MIGLLAQDIRVLENFGGAAWANQTTIHPLGLAMTLVCGVAVLTLPRRYAVWPFIVLACFVAPAQRLVVGGLDFSLMRLMVLFGFARIFLQHEFRGMRWLTMDYAIIAFAGVRSLMYTIQQGTFSALIYQAGFSFDAVGLYFVFRVLIRQWEDIVRAVVGFVVMSVPVLVAFIIENRTGRNAFAMFGGVPEITLMREGRLRCQGAFAHPIIAGCFWASLLPMVAALWWQRGTRLMAVLGCVTILAIVVLTSSSTPVMGVMFAALGGVMFFVRWWMRYICLGVFMLGVAMHMSMQAPIWHLISRITIAQGNTGWHRFMLIDQAVKRFGEWGMFGTPSTAHWFFGGQDVTNQYLLEGVRGGFLTLVLFITIIVMSFRLVGGTWRLRSGDRATLVMAWALGVSIFVHCTNFIGVSYFGQGTMIWFLALAMVGSAAEVSRRQAAAGASAALRPRASASGGRLITAAMGARPVGMIGPVSQRGVIP